MQGTALTILLAILAQNSLASTPILPSTGFNTEILDYLSEENDLTNVLSEIVGIDIPTFIVQVVETGSTIGGNLLLAQIKYDEISVEASPEFKMIIKEVRENAFAGIISLVNEYLGNIPDSSREVSTKINVFVENLLYLAENENISRVTVGHEIDSLLDGTFTSNLRQELQVLKLGLKLVFIIDDTSTALADALAKEKPEIADQISALVNDITKSVISSIKPLLQMMRPLVIDSVKSFPSLF